MKLYKMQTFENIKFKKNNIGYIFNFILIYVFTISSVFMPNDNFNIKKIILLMLLLINIPLLINTKKIIKSKLDSILILMGAVFPTFFIVISILMGNNVLDAISNGYSGFYLLLFFIIKDYHINYGEIFLTSLKFLAVVIVVGAILDILGIVPLYSNSILAFLHNTNNAMIGKGLASTSFGRMIFLKTSPLLLVLLSYSLKNKQIFFVCLSLSAIFFSGTRANVFLGIFIMLIFSLFIKKNKYTYALQLVGVIIFTILILVFSKDLLSAINNMFTARENNDQVRFGQVQSIIQLFKDRPLSIVFGTGFGSYIYSIGSNKIVNILEISYLDLWRQIGLLGMFPFLYFLLKPINILKKNYEWLLLPYVGYLMASFTNPFLYSSTGYLMYIYIFYILDKKLLTKNEKNI